MKNIKNFSSFIKEGFLIKTPENIIKNIIYYFDNQTIGETLKTLHKKNINKNEEIYYFHINEDNYKLHIINKDILLYKNKDILINKEDKELLNKLFRYLSKTYHKIH